MAAEAAVAAVPSSASGLRPSSSAPTLPRAVPHRATAAELKALIKLPFASPAALQWAASGAAGVGGQPGVAAAAATAAVRRVGGASAPQIYPKLPYRGGGTPASTARPPAPKPRRPKYVHYYGESYRSVSPRSSFTCSLPSLAADLPEQARRGPRSISALLGLTLHPSLLPAPQPPPRSPPTHPPLPPLSLPALAAPSAALPRSGHPGGLSNEGLKAAALCIMVVTPCNQAHSTDVSYDEIKGAQRSPQSGLLYASQWLRAAPCSPHVKPPQRSSGRVLGNVPVTGAFGGVW